MSASLVGSEMCIRDSPSPPSSPLALWCSSSFGGGAMWCGAEWSGGAEQTRERGHHRFGRVLNKLLQRASQGWTRSLPSPAVRKPGEGGHHRFGR
eukprot:5433355-Alexandrium_andersonii.AAC.1